MMDKFRKGLSRTSLSLIHCWAVVLANKNALIVVVVACLKDLRYLVLIFKVFPLSLEDIMARAVKQLPQQ